MRDLFIIISLFLITNLNAQQIKEKISYVSTNKDTLILPNNSLGLIIAKIWEKEPIPNEKTPIIIFKNEKYINKRNQKRNEKSN